MAKKLSIVIVVILVILIVYMLSNPGLDMMLDLCRENWETASWAPGLFYKVGTIALWTVRLDKTIDICIEFLDLAGVDHKLSADTSLRLAICYEKQSMKAEAYDEYLWFADTWPDHEKAQYAVANAKRLAHIPTYGDIK